MIQTIFNEMLGSGITNYVNFSKQIFCLLGVPILVMFSFLFFLVFLVEIYFPGFPGRVQTLEGMLRAKDEVQLVYVMF